MPESESDSISDFTSQGRPSYKNRRAHNRSASDISANDFDDGRSAKSSRSKVSRKPARVDFKDTHSHRENRVI